MSNESQVDTVLSLLQAEIQASTRRKNVHYNPSDILFSRRFPDIPDLGDSHQDLNIVIRRTFVAMSIARNDGAISFHAGEKILKIMVFGSEEAAVARAMSIHNARKAKAKIASESKDAIPLRKQPRK